MRLLKFKLTAKEYAAKYLLPGELEWSELQPFLLRHGYALRPRYQPNWVPSWARKRFFSVSKYRCEDYTRPAMWTVVIDAVRTSDTARVVIKRVSTSTDEISILRYLNDAELRHDGRNNVVELCDIILAPATDETAYIVMPKLILFATIPFQFVSEVCDMFKQFLQGMSFLHEHYVAHMDACFQNLMMDPTNVLLDEFHMFRTTRTERDINKVIQYGSRKDAGAVRYTFIDVGLSQKFLSADSDFAIFGHWGQDETVPEFQNPDHAHDPFKTDIYQLGAVFRRIVQHYTGLSAFKPLINQMTMLDPEQRPTAAEASAMLTEIVSSLTDQKLLARIFYRASSEKDRELLVAGQSPPHLLDPFYYLFPERNYLQPIV